MDDDFPPFNIGTSEPHEYQYVGARVIHVCTEWGKSFYVADNLLKQHAPTFYATVSKKLLYSIYNVNISTFNLFMDWLERHDKYHKNGVDVKAMTYDIGWQSGTPLMKLHIFAASYGILELQHLTLELLYKLIRGAHKSGSLPVFGHTGEYIYCSEDIEEEDCICGKEAIEYVYKAATGTDGLRKLLVSAFFLENIDARVILEYPEAFLNDVKERDSPLLTTAVAEADMEKVLEESKKSLLAANA